MVALSVGGSSSANLPGYVVPGCRCTDKTLASDGLEVVGQGPTRASLARAGGALRAATSVGTDTSAVIALAHPEGEIREARGDRGDEVKPGS